MTHFLTLERLTRLTPSVYRLTFNRPDGYDFEPGQATDLALEKEGLRDEPRPFTFTSLPDAPKLEFTIKSYPDHDGVTQHIPQMTQGDQVRIGDPWGAIADEGCGVFIAGGAGVTPFIPILRARAEAGRVAGCSLVLADKTWENLILRDTWVEMQNLATHFVLADEERDGCRSGHVDRETLEMAGVTRSSRVYLCGPPPMQEAVLDLLGDLGVAAENVIQEE